MSTIYSDIWLVIFRWLDTPTTVILSKVSRDIREITRGRIVVRKYDADTYPDLQYYLMYTYPHMLISTASTLEEYHVILKYAYRRFYVDHAESLIQQIDIDTLEHWNTPALMRIWVEFRRPHPRFVAAILAREPHIMRPLLAGIPPDYLCGALRRMPDTWMDIISVHYPAILLPSNYRYWIRHVVSGRVLEFVLGTTTPDSREAYRREFWSNVQGEHIGRELLSVLYTPQRLGSPTELDLIHMRGNTLRECLTLCADLEPARMIDIFPRLDVESCIIILTYVFVSPDDTVLRAIDRLPEYIKMALAVYAEDIHTYVTAAAHPEWNWDNVLHAYEYCGNSRVFSIFAGHYTPVRSDVLNMAANGHLLAVAAIRAMYPDL